MGKSAVSLKESYYTPSKAGSFGGVAALKRSTKKNTADIKNWLSFQDAYTLHKPVRRKFPRRKTIVGGIDHLWQADLVDVSGLKKYNKSYRFLLTCIDVFSKFAWVVPLKSKSGASLVEGFRAVLNLSRGRKPRRLQTDKGSEFKNKKFQAFLEDESIDFYTTENDDIKAAVVERFNRTFKEKMWRYFTHNDTLEYLSVLQNLVVGYNDSFHSSIKTRPSNVSFHNQEIIWQRLFGGVPKKKNNKKLDELDSGDRVRISQTRRPFQKAYVGNWSQEAFVITKKLRTTPTTYRLRDLLDKKIKGTFYRQELQKIGENDIFRIEKTLKTRKGKRKGDKEYLVKWSGYSDAFNSWIPQNALLRLKKKKKKKRSL